MPERNIWREFKEKISKHIIIVVDQKFDIDRSYMFASDTSSLETWREFAESWGPEGKLALRPIVTEALRKNKKERRKLIENLCECNHLIVTIRPEAQEKLKNIQAHIQTIINVNSMSDINIKNLAKALEIEVQVD